MPPTPGTERRPYVKAMLALTTLFTESPDPDDAAAALAFGLAMIGVEQGWDRATTTGLCGFAFDAVSAIPAATRTRFMEIVVDTACDCMHDPKQGGSLLMKLNEVLAAVPR